MIQFVLTNLGTIIVSIVLILIVSLIVRKMIIDKKKGKNSCGGGCGCGNCPSSSVCHK